MSKRGNAKIPRKILCTSTYLPKDWTKTIVSDIGLELVVLEESRPVGEQIVQVIKTKKLFAMVLVGTEFWYMSGMSLPALETAKEIKCLCPHIKIIGYLTSLPDTAKNRQIFDALIGSEIDRTAVKQTLFALLHDSNGNPSTLAQSA